jgi:hypothetical protein
MIPSFSVGVPMLMRAQRDQIITKETYDHIFDRCYSEIVEGETKHLVVLLGVPIAYPRLVWLETMYVENRAHPLRAQR